jgi:hypothetical protein
MRYLENMVAKLGDTLTHPVDWRRGLGQVLMRLHHHGKPVLNYSTHTPYLYQRDRRGRRWILQGCFTKSHSRPLMGICIAAAQRSSPSWHCSRARWKDPCGSTLLTDK